MSIQSILTLLKAWLCSTNLWQICGRKKTCFKVRNQKVQVIKSIFRWAMVLCFQLVIFAAVSARKSHDLSHNKHPTPIRHGRRCWCPHRFFGQRGPKGWLTDGCGWIFMSQVGNKHFFERIYCIWFYMILYGGLFPLGNLMYGDVPGCWTADLNHQIIIPWIYLRCWNDILSKDDENHPNCGLWIVQFPFSWEFESYS